MRVFISGQKLFGESVLRLCLQRGHEVTGVSAPIESDSGRPDRLRTAALTAGIMTLTPGELSASTLPDGTDLILAAHSHDFIGRPTRQKARLGAIGYHPSLLPLHRGRDSIRWAVHMRERVTGGSIYWLSDTVDGGHIAAQHHVFIRADDTPESLWRRELFPLGLFLFARVLSDLKGGTIVQMPQRQEDATWEPSFGRQQLFRPELPQLGTIDGFGVRTKADYREATA